MRVSHKLKMKKYLSFFKIRFLAGLQYRAAAWAGIATQFFWGAMTLLMFRAFYRTGADSFPMTFPELANYIWLQQAFLAMFMTWFYDNDIFDSITSGSISYELCRPIRLYTMWFVKNMAIRLSRVVLRCLPILILAVLLPAPFNLTPPPHLSSGLLALLSLMLGFLVLIAFNMLIYISAFYTLSAVGLKNISTTVMEFLSGAILPLPFFPSALQPVLKVLPFASIQSTPFLIYSGHFEGAALTAGLALQAVWLIVLLSVGWLLMQRALKKVVVQGG